MDLSKLAMRNINRGIEQGWKVFEVTEAGVYLAAKSEDGRGFQVLVRPDGSIDDYGLDDGTPSGYPALANA